MKAFRTYTVVGVMVCLGSLVLAHGAEAEAGCFADTVANDSTNGTNAYGPYLGSAIGQVFYTPVDTLITSIRVWRSALPTVYGRKLFFFGTEKKVRPEVNKIFL